MLWRTYLETLLSWIVSWRHLSCLFTVRFYLVLRCKTHNEMRHPSDWSHQEFPTLTFAHTQPPAITLQCCLQQNYLVNVPITEHLQRLLLWVRKSRVWLQICLCFQILEWSFALWLQCSDGSKKVIGFNLFSFFVVEMRMRTSKVFTWLHLTGSSKNCFETHSECF